MFAVMNTKMTTGQKNQEWLISYTPTWQGRLKNKTAKRSLQCDRRKKFQGSCVEWLPVIEFKNEGTMTMCLSTKEPRKLNFHLLLLWLKEESWVRNVTYMKHDKHIKLSEAYLLLTWQFGTFGAENMYDFWSMQKLWGFLLD